MVKTEEILRFEENPEKNPEKMWSPNKIPEKILSYHIWEVNHQICEEIWLKPLKSKDLRIVLKKSSENKKKALLTN